MSRQLSRVLIRILCAAAVTIVTFGSPSPSAAQTAGLVGGWRVQFDFGDEEEAFGVVLINQGGTVNVVDSDEGRADGVWKQIGPDRFALTLDGFEDDGRFRARVTIRLVDNNNLTATLTIDQMTPDGKRVAGFLGQGRLTGKRMVVVAEP